MTSTSERAYEPPNLRVLGSVGELTAMPIDKKDGPTDGLVFITLNQEITNASR